MNRSEHDLIEAYLADRMDPEGYAELQDLLRRDADARRLLLDLSTLDVKLERLASVGVEPLNSTLRGTAIETPKAQQIQLWLKWRPLAAAAAGLVFGILSASMVWAYAIPSGGRTTWRKTAIFSEGFENLTQAPKRGISLSANQWSGDMRMVIDAHENVKPLEGNTMVLLIPGQDRKFSYAWRIVDLSEHPAAASAALVHLEVAASFHTPSAVKPSHYQIRLAAFRENPEEIREIWKNEPLLYNTVLQHIGRNVATKAGDAGWQRVEASMQIPPETRSIIISLAAGDADMEHLLDDVNAQFVFSQIPPE